MSVKTGIQWCDSTINPIMGCAGCELYPSPEQLLTRIDQDLVSAGTRGWQEGTALEHMTGVIAAAWQKLLESGVERGVGHRNELTTTNVHHLRHDFGASVAQQFGDKAGKLAVAAIERQLSCYAAQLHANRGFNITKPMRKPNKGYAPTFGQLTQFPGRLAAASRLKDLCGTDRLDKPWLDGLPRMIFVSDMGDAFSSKQDFDYLSDEVMAFQTAEGQRHLWLWLTKRPHILGQFARLLGGFSPNVCAMTTVTSGKHLNRIDKLRNVEAPVRGLSLEPLWEPVADRIDLTGIDWVIVGGESGAKANVKPFPLEWAIELRDLCEEKGVAFFMKQLGRLPVYQGVELNLKDAHGGDWSEWPSEFCVRKMPKYFHDYADASSAKTMALTV